MPPAPQINWVNTAKRSSNIARVGHDARASTLTIAFKSRGTYRYGNVPTPLYMTFMAQPSLGKAFNQMFYGRPKEHPSTKLEPTSGH